MRPVRAHHPLDWTARLIRGAVFLLPVVCWPQPGSAFAAPKMLLLAGIDLALAVAWLSRGLRRYPAQAEGWLALAWISAISISALAGAAPSFASLLLALLPVPIYWSIGQGLVPPPFLARALWLGTTCESVIVVLQFCGLDPLRALGWQPEVFPSPRMRGYGTFGNPDFVAAWCCAALPLCWREIIECPESGWARAPRWAAAVVQVAAILATGSRIFALAIVVQAALAGWCSTTRKRVWLWALPAAAAILYFAPARSLASTLQGRLYFARITASHWQTPPAGYGPGSFEERFAVWQADWLQAHRQDPGASRFAGFVDHAHNDYLEFLVEYGPVGLGVFLVVASRAVAQVWRRHHRLGNIECAAALGTVTLLAISMVDFPFHRPAEWSLLWLFLGILAKGHAEA